MSTIARAGKRLLIAIGGNSIIKNPKKTSIAEQAETIKVTAMKIATLVTQRGYEVAITHGNGPQVGFSMQRSEYGAAHHVPALPLEIIDAQTEGQIGYQLTQAIRNALVSQGQRDPRVCAVVNQVRVEADDKAFQTPTKPVGGFFSEQEAKAKMETDQWDMIEQQGRGWRRVVASPEPKEIIEQWAIESLMEKGGIVICVGGGGIPVVRDTDTGDLKGVAAVIDKDSASALLADHMQFDAVVFCTGVANVYVDFNTPSQRTLTAMNVQQAQQHMKDGHFPAGSMGPKVAAALGFLEQTNKGGRERKCYITDPEHLLEALDGNSEHGTVITV